jgi:quinol monooxygenase YgiN
VLCRELDARRGKAAARNRRNVPAGLYEDEDREDCTMTEIDTSFDGQTVITTFEMTPGTAADLMEALQSAYAEFIRLQPGFLGAALHMNDAQTRICNYSKWRRREDFMAMLRTEEMRARNRVIAGLCRGFEPVMYDVVAVF